ncbi:YdeI/OmpD-associated family protein [Mucilaginibacter sp. L3T2-6]|uniref:YdeI/OmpD-associated family protein n=1 Tax=Mucilaginibacter sp. L3T2-6 TaxID=3062491 RepID=UPI002675FD16|nr:YdeI/OmpD-associated family protein [Mucilaginibacter sp. L3T2-6]MDO3644889.1 YdeI/OmpD-associated family protein [Mucilaginibacter sp. L3T2-6]MDV6217340.1 YdeI/OmpD-associated family protein [Mucilaginibacter sp. L3T2-6]
MVTFDAIILQFGEMGEKTGWQYVNVPADIAQELKPGNKKSFRVRGMLDAVPVAGIALLPMGGGDFILVLKAALRKALRKNKGAMLKVTIEEDTDFKIEMPEDLKECLEFEEGAMDTFNAMPGSHRNYFIKWINDAKTEETRAKRIVNTINAMLRKWSYNQMMRELKKEG